MYICIDEWENLSVAQQQALNRWIKNCERPITYKIGVREGGMQTMDTGGSSRSHSTRPADYIETRIAGPTMKSFCRECSGTQAAAAEMLTGGGCYSGKANRTSRSP